MPLSASPVPFHLCSLPLLGRLQEKTASVWLWLWLWLLRFPNRLAEILAGAPVRIARLFVWAEARGDSAAGGLQRSSSWWSDAAGVLDKVLACLISKVSGGSSSCRPRHRKSSLFTPSIASVSECSCCLKWHQFRGIACLGLRKRFIICTLFSCSSSPFFLAGWLHLCAIHGSCIPVAPVSVWIHHGHHY